MDKNTYTGLFLIMLILFGFFYLTKPSEADIKLAKAREHQDSLKRAGIKQAAATAKADSASKTIKLDSAALRSPFGATMAGTEQFITLENDEMIVKLSTLGGRIQSVELKNYKTFDKQPLVLFNGVQNHLGLYFTAAGKSINTNTLYFKQVSADATSVTLRLNYSPNQYIDYVYSLPKTGYKLGFNIKMTGLEQIIPSNAPLTLGWQASLNKTEKDMTMERQYSTVYYKDTEGEVNNLNENKDDTIQIKDKKLDWVSFKQHFFSNVLIYKSGFANASLHVSSDTSMKGEVKQTLAKVQLPNNTGGYYPMTFYFGPNQFEILKAQGDDLEKQIAFGWGPLKYINRWVVLPVFGLLKTFGWNYGLIILALTILLKLVLSPLTYRSYLSMAKMRILKPEIDEIKAKVGEDNPTLLQQETMKLYKKAGVNPLGGCLPMLLQLPIVFAFLRFFPALFELRGQSFLWMKDLSTYDDVIKFGTNIPFLGDHISLMCLLMTISTFIYTYFNNQISGVTGQMKYIGYITPVIFIVVLNKYPSGLNYYYFLANMLTFTQQYLIRLMVDEKKIHAEIQENKKKPEDKTKKKSAFAQRMEDYMKQQQQIQQANKKK
ncbi:preprotein translocase YidC [Mucilaginibacter sp. PPCGB 2223]|uniref:membrane protein insertase YidC n=1 Tax=Mucilaginibacter sp. PPCGB 2223 TaxID=1886027 RepID=UPI000825FA5E|nr:membrane protein insertase YidC [Mucilaginibacter sp. PPCGB 2223]OCX53459.1 preprotein translocase YidC [Mucilaginibacter sp. PPCGB 2223]